MLMNFVKDFNDAMAIDDFVSTPEEWNVIDPRVEIAFKRQDRDRPFSLYLPNCYELGALAYKITTKAMDYAGKKLLGLGR